MKSASLGHLKRVPLRTIWQHEAQGFTPWLAQQENLELLGETIGQAIELIASEHDVGPYSADIVCTTKATNEKVVIENQLEKTDHKHLGQIITYAAGLEACTVIWVAETFTDEHRAAIDWLNSVSNERIGFFAVELELWSIGDSKAAPKFNVVSRPNSWTKRLAESSQGISSENLTPTKKLQLEYWTQFRRFLESNRSQLASRQPRAQHWFDFSIGRSGFWLSANFVVQQNRSTVLFVIGHEAAKAYFKIIEKDRVTIESEIGEALDWRVNDEGKQSMISISKSWKSIEDRNIWPQMNEWYQSKLESFEKTFAKCIRALPRLGEEEMDE